MGLWPGEEFFGYRYDYSTEYVQVMRDLWTTGSSDFKGKYFQMEDCKLSPRPQTPIKSFAQDKARAAWSSAPLRRLNFTWARASTRRPRTSRPTRRWRRRGQDGRDVGNYVLMMVIADETDREAMAKWKLYNDARHRRHGVDAARPTPIPTRPRTAPPSASPPRGCDQLQHGHLGRLLRTVAKMLDECATVPATKGIMLTFDDFLIGMEQFGQRIQPLMKSRQEKLKAVA